jgi:hypothetical protein
MSYIATELFNWGSDSLRYPEAPGARHTDTSKAAAISMSDVASSLRGQCLAALKTRQLTADEIAEAVGASVLAIRPRVTELRMQGLVFDSGHRRPNASGRKAIVWTANTASSGPVPLTTT